MEKEKDPIDQDVKPVIADLQPGERLSSFTIRRGKENQVLGLKKREEAQFWLEEILHKKYGMDLEEGLRNGVDLCNVMILLGVPTMKPPKEPKHEMKMMENVEHFLAALKQFFGIKKGFLSVDLVHKRNLLDVYLSISELRRQVKSRGIQPKSPAILTTSKGAIKYTHSLQNIEAPPEPKIPEEPIDQKKLMTELCDLTAVGKQSEAIEMLSLPKHAQLDINILDEDGDALLHVASREGAFEFVKYLIEKRNGNVNLESTDGETPLHCASESGHSDIVQYLLSKGAVVDPKSMKTTPLHLAIEQGDLDIVKVLVKAGCQLNVPNKDGEKPVYLAAMNDARDILAYLMEVGAQINECFLLHDLTIYQRVDTAKFLIEHGANVNQAAPDGRTPLMLATMKGCVPLMELFLSKGAKQDSVDNYRYTPLQYANTPYLRCIFIEHNLRTRMEATRTKRREARKSAKQES